MGTSRDLHCSSGLCMGGSSHMELYCYCITMYQPAKSAPKRTGAKILWRISKKKFLQACHCLRRTFISVTECRFYFSYPKAKEFDLSYLVTNGGIWEVEYDAIYATELLSTREG